jgi:nitroimidazol reductase NimA-like FMN-containing flavoprotein (pyridoxamine 5'-phosphate oxidase superfamily)
MTYVERTLLALSRKESVELLSRSHVGRVVYTEQAMPAVAAVPFAYHQDCLVMHTSGDDGLASAVARGSILAFEIDDIDPATRTGWSVVVQGEPAVATDVAERADIEHALEAWAPGHDDVCIRLPLTIVTGRRIEHSTRTPTGPDT